MTNAPQSLPTAVNARSITVIVLNQTNEELCLDVQSQHLVHGVWTAGMMPPPSILAGGHGIWASESNMFAAGTKGSVRYFIAGGSPEDKITFYWDNPYVGHNIYKCTGPPSGFTTKTFGGEGTHATAAFIFSVYNPIETS